MSRPTKYRQEYNQQAYELCLLGYTDKELAEYFGVNPDTIYEWKNKFSEFSESIKKGKAPADANVSAAIYKRACGYSYEEVTQEDVNGTMKVTKIVTKEVTPDATSAIFWLKNRQPEKWRDKKEIEAKVSKEVDLTNLTDDELDRLEEILNKTEPKGD